MDGKPYFQPEIAGCGRRRIDFLRPFPSAGAAPFVGMRDSGRKTGFDRLETASPLPEQHLVIESTVSGGPVLTQVIRPSMICCNGSLPFPSESCC
jgi:hypothetical protein